MIRPVELKDFDEVFMLMQEFWPQEYLDYDKGLATFKKALADEKTIFFILEFENKVRGYVRADIRQDFQEQGGVGTTHDLFVHESCRKKGFGKKLLEHTCAELKKRDCLEVRLHSSFKRKNAHRFYEHLGFTKSAYLFWKEL